MPHRRRAWGLIQLSVGGWAGCSMHQQGGGNKANRNRKSVSHAATSRAPRSGSRLPPAEGVCPFRTDSKFGEPPVNIRLLSGMVQRFDTGRKPCGRNPVPALRPTAGDCGLSIRFRAARFHYLAGPRLPSRVCFGLVWPVRTEEVPPVLFLAQANLPMPLGGWFAGHRRAKTVGRS